MIFIEVTACIWQAGDTFFVIFDLKQLYALRKSSLYSINALVGLKKEKNFNIQFGIGAFKYMFPKLSNVKAMKSKKFETKARTELTQFATH